MTRQTALAIGVAALIAGTSVGVIKARSNDTGPGVTNPSTQPGPIEPGGSGVIVDVDGIRPLRDAPEGAALISYSSCGEFMAAVRAEAIEHVGPWGWQRNGYGGGFRTSIDDDFAVEESAPDRVSAEAAPAPAEEPSAAFDAVGEVAAQAGVDFSVTNVQEKGIDEPDIIKTDGKTIYAVVQGSLFAIDAKGAEPRLLDRLALDDWGAQLLLTGDTLLVIGHGGFGPYGLIEPTIEPGFEAFDEIAPYGGSGTTLTLVDVSRPDRLEVAETLTVEGSYITARLTGKSIRLVTSSFPEVVPFVYPEESGFMSELNAGLENQRIVSRLGASDWLPDYVREDHRSGASESGLAVGCSSVRMPVERSGFGMLSVFTLDPAKGLSPVDSDAVMTDAQTVYASPEGLYVSTPFWSNDSRTRRGDDFFGGRENTLIHRFDISAPFDTAYTGSGEVRGSLLNQFSMSEHKGYLRVASTDHSDQESYVTVLDTQSDELKTVGRVGNLGLGEQIYAVRFMGDTGYVSHSARSTRSTRLTCRTRSSRECSAS